MSKEKDDGVVEDTRIVMLSKQGLESKRQLFKYLAKKYTKDDIRFKTLHVNIFRPVQSEEQRSYRD